MRRLLARIPAVLYAATIAYLSHLPGLQPPLEFAWGDKLVHVVAYIGFGIALALALVAHSPALSFRRIVVWTLLLGAVYAALDELHQLFVPYRIADPVDWAADLVGLSLSLPVSRLFYEQWYRWLWKA
jgi:VanZ family protein